MCENLENARTVPWLAVISTHGICFGDVVLWAIQRTGISIGIPASADRQKMTSFKSIFERREDELDCFGLNADRYSDVEAV
jgi:hypothetical protein